jgi:hypothetical protein
MWGACIAAGAAAWVVAAPRRHQYHEMLLASARQQMRVYLGGLLAVAVGSLAGYAVIFAWAAWTTAPRATHGGLNAVELLATLASIPMAVGIGAAAGRYVPPTVAPVIAGVTPFVTYVCLTYAEVYSANVVFTDFLWADQVDRTYLRLPSELLLSRAMFWAFLGVALLCWLFRANRTAYSLALAAGMAGSVMLLTAGVRADARSEYAAICVDGRPRVCVDRAHLHLLHEYRRQVLAGLSEIRGLDLSERTIVQDSTLFENSLKFTGSAPENEPARQLVVPIVKRNTAPAHEIAAATFRAQLGFAIFLLPCLKATDGSVRPQRTEEGIATATILYHWWLTVSGLPTDGSNYPGEPSVGSALSEDAGLANEARQFIGMPLEDRATWFSLHRDQVMTCTAARTR